MFILETLKWGYVISLSILLLLFIIVKQYRSRLKDPLATANFLIAAYLLLSIAGFIAFRISKTVLIPAFSEFPFPYNLLYEVIIPAVFIIIFCFRTYVRSIVLSLACAAFLLSEGFIDWFISLHRDYLPSGWAIDPQTRTPWRFTQYFLLFQVMTLPLIFLMNYFRTAKKPIK